MVVSRVLHIAASDHYNLRSELIARQIKVGGKKIILKACTCIKRGVQRHLRVKYD